MERNFIIVVQKSSYPQMGALYLTNALKRQGIRTHVIGSGASTDELDALIEACDPIAVGCSVMTAPELADFIKHSVHIQEKYNAREKKIPVFWGGMHPTIVSDQTIKEPYIDFVVSGEAELTFPRVLKAYVDRNELPKHKLITVQTPPVLDEFSPDWDSVDLSDFVFPESHSVHAEVEFAKQNVFYYLLTSRGCTYKCNFCWEVARTAALKAEMASDGVADDLTWRCHGVDWINRHLDDVESRLREKGTKMDGVGLWDDMIFGRGRDAHLARAKRIFETLRDRDFGYLLEVRAGQLMTRSSRWNDAGVTREADLYRCLKETGCMQVFVGTESGNQETLNMIQKGTKLEDYMRLVDISHDVGLPLRFSMIVGFPNESDQSVNDTLDLIERLKDEPYVSVSGPKLFTPYPGTPQYVAAVERGMKVPADTLGWAHLNRYADYRALYPWLEENCSQSTLARIDSSWEAVPEVKKYQADENVILEIVRRH